jgi:hypothetical protein
VLRSLSQFLEEKERSYPPSVTNADEPQSPQATATSQPSDHRERRQLTSVVKEANAVAASIRRDHRV